jgi:hypothetical protein
LPFSSNTQVQTLSDDAMWDACWVLCHGASALRLSARCFSATSPTVGVRETFMLSGGRVLIAAAIST